MMWTDNPALDVERYYESQTDIRPIFGRCVHCGKIIHSEISGYDGDEYVATPDGPVHWDCWFEYGLKTKKEAR